MVRCEAGGGGGRGCEGVVACDHAEQLPRVAQYPDLCLSADCLSVCLSPPPPHPRYAKEGPLRGTDAPVVGVLLYRKHVITDQPYVMQLIRWAWEWVGVRGVCNEASNTPLCNDVGLVMQVVGGGACDYLLPRAVHSQHLFTPHLPPTVSLREAEGLLLLLNPTHAQFPMILPSTVNTHHCISPHPLPFAHPTVRWNLRVCCLCLCSSTEWRHTQWCATSSQPSMNRWVSGWCR